MGYPGRLNYASPLRYPGGKGRLAGFFSQLITANGLEGGNYIEPFAGGAGVGISLLLQDKVRTIAINDVDRPIHSFWRAVLDHPEDMAQLIRETSITVEQWKEQKKVQKKPDATVLQLGFSTFYLNRTNRSGILDGGPIGGLDQKGAYKIDARYNKEELAKRIERIAAFSDRIVLYDIDAEALVRGPILDQFDEKTLIYLDPPYYQKGACLYMNSYEHTDHLRLSQALDKARHHWIVSYDNVPVVRDLYRPYSHREFCLNYSAYEWRKGSEIMFFSKGIELPEDLSLPGQVDSHSCGSAPTVTDPLEAPLM